MRGIVSGTRGLRLGGDFTRRRSSWGVSQKGSCLRSLTSGCSLIWLGRVGGVAGTSTPLLVAKRS